MSKFLMLLLLLSSEFQFGQFQEMPKAESILELIDAAIYVGYWSSASDVQDLYDAINASASYKGPLKLQYSINQVETMLNMNLPLLKESERIRSKAYGPHGPSTKIDIGKMIYQLFTYLFDLADAMKEIRTIKYKRQSSDLSHAVQPLMAYYDLVQSTIDGIQTLFAPSAEVGKANENKNKSLAESYELFAKENMLHRCGTGRSPQQTLLELYSDIMKTDFAITEVLIFLTSLKNLVERKRNDDAWLELRRKFILRYNTYLESFMKVFDKLTREHRSCDPDTWARGTSFFELVKFNQETAFHRSGSKSRRSQRPNCNDWINELMNKDDDNSRCEGPDSEACWMHPMEKCNGDLLTCFSDSVTRCIFFPVLELYPPKNRPLIPGKPRQSRRYLWIKPTTNSAPYGNTSLECAGAFIYLEYDYGDTCICRCIEKNNKISLDLSLSDIEEGRVVTAMKLAQMNDTVFIQIKQGTLQPDGRIANESSSWKPSSPSQDPDKLFVLDAPGQGINLDDLRGDDDEVLTGIGLARADEASNTRVRLRIRVTRFNYAEGKLGGESRFISASDQDRKREMYETNSPLDHQLENLPMTWTNETSKRYILFERSNMFTDAGQTTLPLFDAVPVEGKPLSPLSGAGLFHKNVDNFAGFLSLKAIGINLANRFKENMKPLPLLSEGPSFQNLTAFIEQRYNR